MSNFTQLPPGEAAAYRQGWRAGLALGALAIAAVAFINLLSFEKSMLAAVLALIAIVGAGPGRARSRGRLALIIAVVHLALAPFAIAWLYENFWQLISLLQSLG